MLMSIALLLVIAQIAVPRRLVLIPFFVAAFHVPAVLLFEPSFSVVRLVLLTLLARALAEKRLGALEWHSVDRWMLAWSCVLVATALLHGSADGNPVITRLGVVFDVGGAYLCARAYIRQPADFERFCSYLPMILVPLAVAMAYEKVTGQNAYEWLGATFSMVRNGHVRAAGSFDNAILAGTVGAVLFPIVLVALRQYRFRALLGATACLAIVYCATSSGPVATLAFAIAVLLIRRWRNYVGWFLTVGLALLLTLHLMMNDPVWYLLARLDVTGGSVGFHRAELITQALEHLQEWWLWGTDRTRHWIPYGVPWSANHADITNYYIKMGVLGGLPLLLMFLGLVVAAFRLLGKSLRAQRRAQRSNEFMLWCVNSSLASYCVAFLGVAPYDQSLVVLFTIMGSISGLGSQGHFAEARASASHTRERWSRAS
jgi:hypothetical protein